MSEISEKGNQIFCRICHCDDGSEIGPLIAPCNCAGSLRYVHRSCLQQWTRTFETRSCEICRFKFLIQMKLRGFSQWKTPILSYEEKKRLSVGVCIVICLAAGIIFSCIWGTLASDIFNSWPFWLAIGVIIGSLGAIVLLFYCCRYHLIEGYRKWRFNNSEIFIEDRLENVVQLSYEIFDPKPEKLIEEIQNGEEMWHSKGDLEESSWLEPQYHEIENVIVRDVDK